VNINESLAVLSNQLVYASMSVLAIAMVLFAAALARGRVTSEVAAGPVRAPALIGAGATLGVDGEADLATVSAAQAKAAGGELPPGRRAGNIAMALTWLAAVLLLGGVVTRGLSAQRVPWGNMYEFSLMGALAALGVYLLMSLTRDLRWLGLFVVVPTLLSLGLAVTVLYTESAQLVPALKSWWLVIHVLAAIVCAGAFTLAGALSVAYLLAERSESRVAAGGSPMWIAARIPSAEKLDLMAYRVVAFSFPLWTFAVIAGAIWAENAWGRYWGWDPKETWAFITWVVFAGYLHARATAGWRGSRAAWIVIVGFVSFMINYFGVNIFVNSLHSYAGV
jgi:cytochrome c-type biogenesis protein CcsB